MVEAGATITIPPPPSPSVALDLTAERFGVLRDYQKTALEKIFSRRWGCVGLATNAGKGAIIALAAQIIADQVGPVVICCDEVAVYDALQQEITKWAGRPPGKVVAGVKVPPAELIVLAMIPTLSRRVNDVEWQGWFSSIQGLLIDEADKASSPSYLKTVRAFTNSHFRVGFSGTFPEDPSPQQLTLQELLGPVLIRVKNIELIERGISAQARVNLYPFSHWIEYPPKEDWKAMLGPSRMKYVYEQAVIQNVARHQFITTLLEDSDPNAIIVNYIEHGKQLEEVIPNSRFLHGTDHPDLRRAVLDEFKRGVFQNLIVSKIMDRGTNELGHTVGLIFASGQGSDRQTLQRIGRGLRRNGGKEFLSLKDIIDRGSEYLESGSRKRLELYNDEGFEIQIQPGYTPRGRLLEQF